MERPQRPLAALVALQANRQMTAAELAEQFAVSKRTILRDIDALAAADVPVVAERGRYGGIMLLPGAEIDDARSHRGRGTTCPGPLRLDCDTDQTRPRSCHED